MRVLKKLLKFTGWFFLILILFLTGFCIYVWKVSDITPPVITEKPEQKPYIHIDSTCAVFGNNWIRKSRRGLYEMYVEGAPYERGLANGILSRKLIVSQEEAFTTQIRKMIPSEGYLKFLKYIIGFMNRDLPDHITEEYKQEIYGISLAASDSFKWIGSNYARQLNYHAAHDIGHALQNMMLVGCTSFGAWNDKTDKGELLLGRNFDFWVGDDFARNKIIEFVNPSAGHKFAFVTWGGFIGVVSGMNEKGLTVTINAAKSKIPFGAATPVSLVAREILQYAGNIKEAVAIARKRNMFVSESFMIGSAADHRTVVIEKTPRDLDIYDPGQDYVICTNHYQGNLLGKQELNREQMRNSASVYRYKRTQQLLNNNYPLTPDRIAHILRDRRGINGKDIGTGNEKAVNQMIAHHSVIFMPDSLRFWVSTGPWQLGEYVCYDLRKIFAMKGLHQDEEIASNEWNIAADSFLSTKAFNDFLQFRRAKMAWADNDSAFYKMDLQTLISTNPEYYDVYRLAGDYYLRTGNYTKAANAFRQALSKEVATREERTAIIKKLKESLEKSAAK